MCLLSLLVVLPLHEHSLPVTVGVGTRSVWATIFHKGVLRRRAWRAFASVAYEWTCGTRAVYKDGYHGVLSVYGRGAALFALAT